MPTNQERSPLSEDVIESLADSISGSIERRRAAKEAIPDVYKSGMRGDEKPPALRNRDTKEARKAGMGKGIDPKKAQAAQGKRNVADDEEDDTKEVKFKASKTSKSKLIKEQQKQIADLTKRLDALEKGKKKLLI